MKNKKGRPSEVVTTLIIILLVLVAIGIVWWFILSNITNQEPQFKITENICSYQKIISTNSTVPCYDSKNNIIQNLSCLEEYRGYLIYNGEEPVDTYEYYPETNTSLYIKYEPFCYEEEVNEIKLSYAGCDTRTLMEDGKETGELYLKECGGKSVWNGTDEINLLLKKGEYSLKWENLSYYIIISKKDLTIFWLDENIRCAESECSGTYKGNIEEVKVNKSIYEQYNFNYMIYNDKIVCGGHSDGSSYSFYLENQPKCLKYKLNNYTIEVIR